MEVEKIKDYRNNVITKFNDIDELISLVISASYLHDYDEDFIANILYDPAVGFLSKQRMLKQVFKRERIKDNENIISKINNMRKIRNNFVHATIQISIKEEGKLKTFSPRNFKKPIDPEKEYKEFIRYFYEVDNFLENCKQHISRNISNGNE